MADLSADISGGGALVVDSLTIGGVTLADYINTLIANSQPLLMPVGDVPSASTGTAFATRAYARYIGRRAKAITDIRPILFVNDDEAAGTGYAEIAIATGTVEDVAGIATTLLTVPTGGWASIDTEVKASRAIPAAIQKNLTIATPIPANTDLWVIFASSYSVQNVVYRAATAVTEMRALDGFRPSLVLDTPTAFSGFVYDPVTCPWMKAFAP